MGVDFEVEDGEAETEGFEFDEAVQTQLVSCLCFDSGFLKSTDGLILPAYFGNQIESVFARISIEHFRKYETAPGRGVWGELLKAAFRDKWFRESDKAEVVAKFGELRSVEVTDRAWLLSRVEEFARHSAITAALIKSAGDLGKTGDDTRFAKIQSTMSKAFETSLKADEEEYDYAAMLGARTQERLEVNAGGMPKNIIPTQISELDNVLLGGGMSRKELVVFMGGAKSSKSFMLTQLAANFYMGGDGFPGVSVLFITMENSLKVCADRLDAYLSKTRISEQFVKPWEMNNGVEAAMSSPNKGKLKMFYRAADTFSPRDLQAMIDHGKAKGFCPDVVVMDYLDLATCDHASGDKIEDIRSTWIGMRSVAAKENCLLLTATQANRTGHASAVLKAEHAASSFDKIRTADLVLALQKSDDEKAESKARLTFVASRNQADGATLFLKQALDFGAAIEFVESVE